MYRRRRTSLTGHTDFVNALAFSPDSSRLASGSSDTTVRIWDTATWESLQTLAEHSGKVNTLAWSPDGSRLASGSADTYAFIWDAASGEELLTLYGETAAVRSPVFSADGKRLAVVYGNGTGHVYALDMDELLRMAGERATRGLTDAECYRYLRLKNCAGK